MTNPCNGHIEPIKVFCRVPNASGSSRRQGGHLLIRFDLITLRAAGTGAVADFPHPTRRYAVGHKPQMRIIGLFPCQQPLGSFTNSSNGTWEHR